MITIATKIYILSKVFEVQESEIKEDFLKEELNMDWDEFCMLDNEDFYIEIISFEDREDFISTIFGYNDEEFIDYIGGFQELDECNDEVFVEMIQNFLIKLFTYEEDKGEIKPITTKDILKSKISFILSEKIIFSFKGGLLKILSPIIKRHYEIKEIPFCLETMSIKDWREELSIQWIIENDIDLDELEEI